MEITRKRAAGIVRHTGSQFYGFAEGKDTIERFVLMKYTSPSSRRAYRWNLRRFVRFIQGMPDSIPADSFELTPEGARNVTSVHVDAFLEYLDKGGNKPATIKLARACVMKFFKHLLATGVIDKNPADSEIIRAAPKVDRESTIKYLSRDQANKTVKAATLTTGVTGLRDKCMILMLVGCALRRSELVGVDVEHIRKNGERWELLVPKGKTGARTVPLETHVLESILALRVEDGIESGALFRSYSRRPDYAGKRINVRTVNRVVDRVSQLAGQKIGTHGMGRHTAATLALDSGAKLYDVQQFLGHNSPKTTTIYLHLVDDAKGVAARSVNVTG